MNDERSAGPYWTLLDPTGPYWTLLNPTGHLFSCSHGGWAKYFARFFSCPHGGRGKYFGLVLAVPSVVGENILEVVFGITRDLSTFDLFQQI